MNKTGTQRLETHRLILRRYRIEDAEDMFSNWASDPEVTKYVTWPAHDSVAITEMVMKDWVEGYANPDRYNWAITLKEKGDDPIGNISAVHVFEKTESVEIGYCMGRAWWGKGVMAEALKAVIRGVTF